MRVKDCMTKQVISVGAGEPVSVAARLMARYNLGALPVRGTDGQLEGISAEPGMRNIHIPLLIIKCSQSLIQCKWIVK